MPSDAENIRQAVFLCVCLMAFSEGKFNQFNLGGLNSQMATELIKVSKELRMVSSSTKLADCTFFSNKVPKFIVDGGRF